MLWVMLACIPGIAAQIWFFGYGVLIQVALAAIVALAAEGAILQAAQAAGAQPAGG